MTFEIPCRFIYFCALLAILTMQFAESCPVNITALCQCSAFNNGLYISCSNVSFQELIAALKSEIKAPINVLIVRDSDVSELNSATFAELSIESLEISNCSLATIADDALQGQQSSLKILNFAHNQLRTVPNLSNFDALESLDLSDNQIFFVESARLRNLTSLALLTLRTNKICDLPRDAFAGFQDSLQYCRNSKITKLIYVDLSQNCFAAVPAQNIRGSPLLASIDLSHNNISELPNLAFTNLRMLRELRLDDNKIEKVGPLAFMNSGNLQFLYLRGNRLKQSGSTILNGLSGLQLIDMGENLIEELTFSAFRDMPLLQQLFLDGNQIQKVETLAFANLPNLKLLNLANNKIKQLYRNAFDSLSSVIMLQLQYNRLEFIEQGMFAGLPNLQQLMLDHNNIVFVRPMTFEMTPSLKVIDLSYNQLALVATMAFAGIQRLAWLDLSMNRIEQLEQGAFDQRVATILIKGNPLQCNESLDWFLKYLVSNQVQIFLPDQENIVCSGPPAKIGVQLRDLLIQQANESYYAAQQISTVDPLFSNLPPIQSLPKELVEHVLKGGKIPGMSDEQLDQLKHRYLAVLQQQIGVLPPSAVTVPESSGSDRPKVALVTASQSEIDRVLGDIDLSRLPPEVLIDLAKGRLPDLDKLPKEFFALLQKNPNLLTQLQGKQGGGQTLKDLEKHLNVTLDQNSMIRANFTKPSFNRRYELEELETVSGKSDPAPQWVLIASLSAVGVLTLVTIVVICCKRQDAKRREKRREPKIGQIIDLLE